MWKLFLLLAPFVLFGVTDEEFDLIRNAKRQVEVHTIKTNVARSDELENRETQKNNGDEKLYDDLRGNFNKGLSHLETGFPNVSAFESLVKALCTGLSRDFNDIQVGFGIYKLVNPQASFAYSLSGIDGWLHSIPPAPTFASAEAAGEMVEVYWTALVRDVNFNDFSTDGTVAMAVADMNTLSSFNGPKVGGVVTPGTFLRGNTPGDLVGPYISQFLYLDIPYGATTIPPEQKVPMAGMANDFVTTFADWLQIESGGSEIGSITYDGTPHFIRTPRDLTEYVHQDFPGQEGLNALLILMSFGDAALDPACYYLNNRTQQGFVTFGPSQFLGLVQSAAEEALKAAWFQKWQVHRRLRPEEFGFYVQQQIANGQNLGIHPDLIGSSALPMILVAYGTYFLPLAYPEGSPVHPSYPAGHATFIGAVTTILKALFNEDFVIPMPLEPNAANTMLGAYVGTPLTVGGELNKLAANISLGRDHAGVHYRSDGFYGMQLGEKIAIDILNNESFLFHEDFVGFTLTKFDGTKIKVGGKRNTF